MAEPKDDKPKLPLTGIVALVLALVSSLLIYQVPLKTSRPIDKEAEKAAAVAPDRVQARLWQDPFEAVTTHRLKEGSQKRAGQDSTQHHTAADVIAAMGFGGASSPILVLPVFMDGSPYASGVESRLRDRYAVVSALGAAGYLPELGEYIRFFEWDQPSGESVVVPIERFQRTADEGQGPSVTEVLVLWLKEQDIGADPLLSLGRLLMHMNCAFKERTAIYRVLGPRSSGSLRAMVDELRLRGAAVATPSLRRAPSAASDVDDAWSVLKGIVLYSSWATAADPFLLAEVPKGAEAKTVEGWFRDGGITLVRAIGTDADLAEQLIEELRRREVDLTVSRQARAAEQEQRGHVPHVALIAEWDTLYGRALPQTFVAVANQLAELNEKQAACHTLEWHLDVLRTKNYPHWVHRYSYLAGLDGELPPKNQDKDGASAKPKLGEGGLRIEQGLAETPAGRSQLDYLRRLVETLKREQATADGEFHAIGVLGSDVYDKLMILQALRSNFPHALFFTTDLDARLTHPSQWPWARNLIVASHFGLALHPKLQTPIPPFRDSYQTALFYSALRAVDHLVEKGQEFATPFGVTVPSEVRPRLYEIGRHGAVDVSPDPPYASPPSEKHLPSLHLPRPDLDPQSGRVRLVAAPTVMLVGAAIVVMLCCALLINSELWHAFRKAELRQVVPGLALAVMLLGGLLCWAMGDGTGGEPFSLTEGVSVWPTTVIRLLAFALCLAFLHHSWWRLRENGRELMQRFSLPDADTAQALGIHSAIGLHDWCPHPKGEVAVEELWKEYRSRGTVGERLMRVLPQTVLYGVLGLLLMFLSEFPVLPCRGAACFQVNQVILLLSVVAMTLLMFYVVDATRLCRRLISIMVGTTIRWPEDLLAKEAAQLGVDKAVVREWVAIQFIAKRTAVISAMIYYPFIIVFLMVVARHGYLDRWDFPIGLLVIFGLNAAYAFGNGVFLRRTAEQAKRAAAAQMRTRLTGVSGVAASSKEKQSLIERMAALIEDTQEGAFLPFTRHPLFGAIALPTGGTGLVFLLEYLATLF